MRQHVRVAASVGIKPAGGAHQPAAATRARAASASAINADFTFLPTHAPIRIQPKLTIGQTDDPLERDAERAADAALRTPNGAPPIRSSTASPNTAQQGIPAPHITHRVLASPGQPLDADTRAFFEPRFGHDFSNVRVHSDGAASQSARQASALAYTAGSHVVFRADQYQPHTAAGRQLIGHELAHVVQHKNGECPAVLHRQAEENDPLKKLFDEIWKKSRLGKSASATSLAKKPEAPAPVNAAAKPRPIQKLLEPVHKTKPFDVDLGKDIDWIKREDEQAQKDKLNRYSGWTGMPVSVQKETRNKLTGIGAPGMVFGGGLSRAFGGSEIGGSVQYDMLQRRPEIDLKLSHTFSGDHWKNKDDQDLLKAMSLGNDLTK